MPRNYIKKKPKPTWTMEDVARASKDVENKKYSLREAASVYEIPLSCLQRRLKKKEISGPHQGRFIPVFNNEQEKVLMEYILEMEKRFYGLTPKDVKRIAYQVAEKLKIPHPFNKKLKEAGDDWLSQFMMRCKNLSLRKPEPTSLERIQGFNKQAVDTFFDLLEEIYKKKQFAPQNVYNLDETGINTVHKPKTIVAEKGQKQVGRMTSGERGKNITVSCAVSATGHFIPPFFIFYQKKMNPLFMKHTFPGSRGVANGSGWMDAETFLIYLDHFIEHAKPSENNPVLVILDGHSSHKSIDAILKCRENFITLLTLPPHTSHQTQPLDRTVFGPVKGAYQTECDDFTGGKINTKITVYDVGELFSKAFRKRATADSGIRGFEVTGIWPCNRNIFSENLFQKPYGTEMPEVCDEQEDVDGDLQTIEELAPINSSQNSTQNNLVTAPTNPTVSPDSSVPVASNLLDSTAATAGNSLDTGEFLNTIKKVSPRFKDGIQIPSTSRGRSNRVKQTSAILTSSPNKNRLLEKSKELQKKLEKKEKKIAEKPLKKNKKKPQKKNISSGSNLKENQQERSPSSNKTSLEEDVECLYCCDKFSRSKAKEPWIKCCKCQKWAHEECAESEKSSSFICVFCRD